ncbi:unnamed protein product [Peronospora belbahrii]|uniref:Uncharacterized protein n=1 Tax=Peronospora belbahrii TaxID=622444 RepID=A0AAU9KSX4_9STRA|nr:unnamed protein product [Peronospora belbahrii]
MSAFKHRNALDCSVHCRRPPEYIGLSLWSSATTYVGTEIRYNQKSNLKSAALIASRIQREDPQYLG